MTINAAAVESFTFPIAHLLMSCRARQRREARSRSTSCRHCHSHSVPITSTFSNDVFKRGFSLADCGLPLDEAAI